MNNTQVLFPIHLNLYPFWTVLSVFIDKYPITVLQVLFVLNFVTYLQIFWEAMISRVHTLFLPPFIFKSGSNFTNIFFWRCQKSFYKFHNYFFENLISEKYACMYLQAENLQLWLQHPLLSVIIIILLKSLRALFSCSGTEGLECFESCCSNIHKHP